MHRYLKQAALLLILNLAFALLIAVAAAPLGYEKGTLPHSVDVLRGKFKGDSWKPMEQALKYWDQEPGQRFIYRDLLIEKNLKFQYPPTALLLPRLIAAWHLDRNAFYSRSTLFFLAVTVLSAWGILLWSLKTFGNFRPSGRDAGLLLAVAALLAWTYYPLVKAATLGQIQVWLNALFAAALLGYLKKRDGWAGILIGLIASIKPQYGLFILWGAARRNWAFTLGILATAAIGFAVGGSVFGFAAYRDYAEGLRYLSQHGEAFYPNQTVNGLVNRLFSVRQPELYNNLIWSGNSFPPYNAWVYVSTLLSSAAILAACLLGRRNEAPHGRGTDFCLMSLGITMASPIGWEHHYGILFPVFAFLWPLLWFDGAFSGQRRARRTLIACYLLSGNFVSIANATAPTYLNVLQSYLLFAALGVFAILFLARQRRPAAIPLEKAPPMAEIHGS